MKKQTSVTSQEEVPVEVKEKEYKDMTKEERKEFRKELKALRELIDEQRDGDDFIGFRD